MPAVMTVESVSKKFHIQRNRALTLKESIIRRLEGTQDRDCILWALHNVSFTVERGSVLGIIGHNGAGKSTLLRLLCGLGRPTIGSIHRMGHISGLLELGTGFHPDLTGRENLITGGMLSGLTKTQVLERQNEIIAFAELEEFIDQPVRTYSNGMYLRLAFAAAINFDPDVLIVDEVLAVGDSRFQQKCLERLDTFRASGKTLVLTSHDTEQIRRLCDEVIVLEEGELVLHGDPEAAIHCFNDLMRQRTERKTAQVHEEVQHSLIVKRGTRSGTQEATIHAVHIYDAEGRATNTLSSGDSLTIEIQYYLTKHPPDVAVLLGIYSETNIKCFETCISSINNSLGSLTKRGIFRCHLPELPLLPGRYYINVGLFPTDWDYIYDYHWQMHPFLITSRDGAHSMNYGVVALDPNWTALND